MARAASADSQQAVLQRAAIWGLPLVLTGRYLALSQQHGIVSNKLYLAGQLATPALHVVAPNIDTLYGFGWLDLSAGPMVLDVPAIPDRYYSIQLIDAYANSFSYVGTRATGSQAGSYVIAPPGFHGAIPAGAHRIDAPTSTILVLTRTLVKGHGDIAAARGVEFAYTLAPLANYPAGKQPGLIQDNALNVFPKLDIGTDGPAFFNELNGLVSRFPPRGKEATAFRKLALLKLGDGFSAQSVPADEANQALAAALAKVAATKPYVIENGWGVNYHNEPFDADPTIRAAVNLAGPGAHIAKEALYYGAAKDAAGQMLDGAHSYTITFSKADLPPVKAFWSLILYDKNYFLVDNPINRYAINDRSEGLVYGTDGSLQIVIQHDKPSGNVNWLPAPQGIFSLILRLYLPEPSVLTSGYKPPAVTRTV